MKNHLYRWGLIFIIMGCIGGVVVHHYAYIFTFLGIILIVYSDKNIWIKLISSLVTPCVVVYGVVLANFLELLFNIKNIFWIKHTLEFIRVWLPSVKYD